ncbi:MAG: protoheme IX farnesyltransferase [Gammaproteobacteria bacterium RIFCSPLOWO2_02_FULL_38_11]|nr:MAG: protoheme IX farnesyltransferase [Gammaproteobacteria bacterium RIFCSPHIGHO2_02_FULL_38_33]OGT24371.1 MAG: protoheme IX farnesyltransferase [Gammaproteobacteria bacterium RIFCSPHIGHO2_12_38_15]OGT68573.1 MAG: protoheme IX farnesyltransferase [Gammaproteobacteria bacterium RIFCSPLOWO2_02_FULL_38_11]
MTLVAYYELCKPRVVALMLITSLVGMLLATPSWVPLRILILGNLGIGLGACAAAVVNHLVDRRIDALMGRTQFRPLPSGRVTSGQAILFASVLAFLSMLILSLWVNKLTALLTLVTLIAYAGVYSLYLKRATPQNIVIGGIAGAAPPLLGWTATTGHIDPHGLLLVLIIFVWTPPHFWALAIQRYKEYARADIPMLPVTHGIPFTKLCIFLYTLLLAAVSVLPYVVGMSGLIYLVAALLLNSIFIFKSYLLLTKKEEHVLAGNVFRFSIWYLFGIFVFLLIDHY